MEIPIFCDLQAVNDEERARLFTLTPELLGRVVGLSSDEFGYDLEFDGRSPELVAKLADFLELDSRCCAWVDHTITLPAGGANVRASLRGRDGTRDALRHDIEGHVPAEVLAAALA